MRLENITGFYCKSFFKIIFFGLLQNFKMVKKTTNLEGKVLSILKKYLIFLIIAFFASLYSFIGIVKYDHYQTGLDLAIYVQQYFFYTHGKLPFVTLYPTLGDLAWADHFSPSLVLLTPFYFLWRDPKILLILQPFIYLTGAYAIWSVAKEKLKNTFLAYALSIAFCLFFGVQFPLTFDFHEATMAAATIAWLLWAMEKKKWWYLAVLSVIGAGFKEDMPLYIFSLGIYLVLARRNWKLGSIMAALSISYFLYITKIIMPGISHIGVKVESTTFFSLSPSYLFSVFFSSPIKIHTIILCLASFLFVPLLSGWFILLLLAHFFINFADPNFPGRWGIYLHYRGYVGAILSFGFIYGYLKLQKLFPNIFAKNKSKIIFGILLLLDSMLMDVALHLPLNTLSKSQFYYTEKWIKDNNYIVSKIPGDGILLTQNDLTPQVSFRQYVYYYPQHVNEAKYIFLDLHPDYGLEAIDFWLSGSNEGKVVNSVQSLLFHKKYKIIQKAGDAILMERINK